MEEKANNQSYTNPNFKEELSQTPIQIDEFARDLFKHLTSPNEVENFRKEYDPNKLINVLSNYNWSNDKDKFHGDFSFAILRSLSSAHTEFLKRGSEVEFFDRASESLDLIYCCYFNEEFVFSEDQLNIYKKAKEEAFSSKTHLLTYIENLILRIGYHADDNTIDYFSVIGASKLESISTNESKGHLNHFLDQFFIKYVKTLSPKATYIQLSPLMYTNNFSTFLSNKLLLLFAHILIQLDFSTLFFQLIISNVSLILKNEGTILSKKINSEYYNNIFEDFDYNVNTHIRKLNNHELLFLKENFFDLMDFTLSLLKIDRFNPQGGSYQSIIINFDRYNVRKTFLAMIEEILEKEKKPDYSDETVSKISKCYILSLLIFDIIDFIYSNFYYFDENFKLSEELVLNIDPFTIFEGNLKPKGYLDFLKQIVITMKEVYSNICTIVEVFLLLNDINASKAEEIKKQQEAEEAWYVVYVPFNHVGFSAFCWILWKDMLSVNYKTGCSFINYTVNPVYLFDIFLPEIAALLKREQNYKYMAIEILYSLLGLINEGEVRSVQSFKSYNYLDILKDLITFLYSNEPQPKRSYLTRNYLDLVKIFDDQAKHVLYEELMKTLNKDHEIAFVINLVKANINYELGRKNFESKIFDTEFLKMVITSTLTDKNFPIDSLETLSQACNFVTHLIVIDKRDFNKRLGICEKSFLESLRKTQLEPIAKIISKWERSSDEEKKKFLKENEQLYMITKEAKKNVENVENQFLMRKNQANCTLRLISILEGVIHKNIIP